MRASTRRGKSTHVLSLWEGCNFNSNFLIRSKIGINLASAETSLQQQRREGSKPSDLSDFAKGHLLRMKFRRGVISQSATIEEDVRPKETIWPFFRRELLFFPHCFVPLVFVFLLFLLPIALFVCFDTRPCSLFLLFPLVLVRRCLYGLAPFSSHLRRPLFLGAWLQ